MSILGTVLGAGISAGGQAASSGKGGGGPSAPTTGDLYDQANLQRTFNNYTLRANRPTQVTPWGTTSWNQTPIPHQKYRVNPKTGQLIKSGWTINRDNWTQNTTLSPELQDILNRQFSTGQSLSKQIQDNLSTPFNYDGIPALEAPNEDYRQKLIDSYTRSARRNLDPVFGQQDNDLRSRLAAQGISADSPLYERQYNNFARNRDNNYLQLADQAFQGSGAEMARLFGLNLQNRTQAISERLAQRDQPLNELASLLGASSVKQPSFGSFATTNPIDVGAGSSFLQQQYNNQLGNYNAQQAQYSNLWDVLGQGIGYGVGRLGRGSGGGGFTQTNFGSGYTF
jgi:hypothetical protein